MNYEFSYTTTLPRSLPLQKPGVCPINKTDYTASLAMNCIDLIEQTNQEGVPSSSYLHLSLTTFYLIHQMTPLNLFGAVSPPTMGLSPLAACVYWPPNSPYNTALQTLEHCIRTTKHNTDYTLITGDLNAKNNAWLSTDNTDPAGEELRDLLVLYGLQQLVDFPTYHYRGTPYSCIDNVATDCSTISVTSTALLVDRTTF